MSSYIPFSSLSSPSLTTFGGSVPLSSLNQLVNMNLSGFKRDALHDIVHAFRDAHGYAEDRTNYYGPKYRQAIAEYLGREADAPDRLVIAALCNDYPEIRTGGRMRMSRPALTQAELELYMPEIKAALVWHSIRLAAS